MNIMKIDNGLAMLELTMNFLGKTGTINPTLVWDDETVILVDTGLPGQLEAIRQEIEKTGVSFEKLNMVIITHHDMDHIGSLSRIQNELGDSLKVLAHSEEKPYVEFEKRPIKMTSERMAQIQAQMLDSQQIQLKEMIPFLKSRVDLTIEDGQELPYCGGIEVIHTPGHTPGHVCLYLKKFKILVSGDGLCVVDGKLVGPNPQSAYDIESALNSLKKLTEYDIQKVICYHGGLYSDNVNQRILELANER
jgi:glyoxylase-like metal-dependent hydrolase (beta-lactamase superfamily II)